MDFILSAAGGVVVLLIGTAINMLQWAPPEFVGARICLIAAAVALGIPGFLWALTSDLDWMVRTIALGATGLFIFVGIPEGIRLIDRRKADYITQQRAGRIEEEKGRQIVLEALPRPPHVRLLSIKDFDAGPPHMRHSTNRLLLRMMEKLK